MPPQVVPVQEIDLRALATVWGGKDASDVIDCLKKDNKAITDLRTMPAQSPEYTNRQNALNGVGLKAINQLTAQCVADAAPNMSQESILKLIQGSRSE